MKRWMVFAIALLLVSFVGYQKPVAFAQPPDSNSGVPGGPFATAFRVQNLGSSNATCTYTVFNSSGSSIFNASLPSISPGASAQVYTPTEQNFPTGVSSAVISCDQPTAAVVNYSDYDSGDTFVGISTPANTLFVPGVYDNFYNYYTSLRVMNASGSSNNVTIRYYDGATQVKTDTFTLNGNGSRAVIHENTPEFATNRTYSAKIEGSGPLAAIVQIYGRGPYDQQLYSYSAFTGGSNRVYVPLVMSNFYRYNTATVVQNAGTSATKVRIRYSNGTEQVQDLAPGAAHTFSDFLILPSSNQSYSAVVESGVDGTSPQPIIVTVNESRVGTKLATTYEGFTAGARKLVAPIVMKNYYGYNSSITCQNIGNGPATISVSFKGTAGNTSVNVPLTQKVANLGINLSAVIAQHLESSLPANFIGSATIESTQDIICVVNQSDQNQETTKDLLYAYNALVQP